VAEADCPAAGTSLPSLALPVWRALAAKLAAEALTEARGRSPIASNGGNEAASLSATRDTRIVAILGNMMRIGDEDNGLAGNVLQVRIDFEKGPKEDVKKVNERE